LLNDNAKRLISSNDENLLLVAEARVARQRELVARLEARGASVLEARSTLSAFVYSLRVLKRRQARSLTR
jgi:arginine repressor